MNLPTRRLDALTSREVEMYLKAGGDLIFVPFGPISGHGAIIPMGIHAHWAEALSVMLAEKANGLVYPPIYTCFAGATRTFHGTVSFPITEQTEILKRVATLLHAQGFKRTVLVAGNFPEIIAGTVAVRELFDQTEHPFWCIEADKLLEHPAVKALYDGYPGQFGETQIGLGSLKFLNRERPIPLPEFARAPKSKEDADQPAEIVDDIRTLRRWGAIGLRYHNEAEHGNHGHAGLTFNGQSDIQLAIDVLNRSADVLLPALNNLRHYMEWLENHPFRFIKTEFSDANA